MSVSVQLRARLLSDGEKLTRIIRFTIGLDAIYTATLLAAEWILPLFPAEPKLGPVYLPIESRYR